MSPARLLIQHTLSQMMKGIKAEQATDMKDITHHAHHATMWAFCNGQPAACPDHQCWLLRLSVLFSERMGEVASTGYRGMISLSYISVVCSSRKPLQADWLNRSQKAHFLNRCPMLPAQGNLATVRSPLNSGILE
jgi:hypothetical protein